VSASQCNDGIDNDGDSWVDGWDPGCQNPFDGSYNPLDDDEVDPPTCSSGEFRCYRMLFGTSSPANHDCSSSDYVDECFKEAGDFIYSNNVGAYNYAALSSDNTCCPLSAGSENVNGCVYNGIIKQYGDGDLGLGKDVFTGLGSGDDMVAYCYLDTWVDLDDGQGSGNPDWVCNEVAGYPWVYSGENNVGEYDNTWTKECCGDDAGENYVQMCPGISGSRKCCSSSSDRINENGDCVDLSECTSCSDDSAFKVFSKEHTTYVSGGVSGTSYDYCASGDEILRERYCDGLYSKTKYYDCSEINKDGNDINAPTGGVCLESRDYCGCPSGEQWLGDKRCGKPCTDDNDDDEYLTR